MVRKVLKMQKPPIHSLAQASKREHIVHSDSRISGPVACPNVVLRVTLQEL
jgi:hypothetical protein